MADLGSLADLNILSSLLDSESSGSDFDKSISKDNLNYSDTPNFICDRYEINTSYEIKDLSTDFVEVFPANDTFIKENSDPEIGQKTDEKTQTELFAYVFRENFPTPINDIIALCSKRSPNINLPIAYGVCPIGAGEEEKFVAIVPKQQGKSLKSILNIKTSLDEKFIKTKLLPQIQAAFEILHSSKIAHGCINVNTIFFDKHGTLILQESLSEPSVYI